MQLVEQPGRRYCRTVSTPPPIFTSRLIGGCGRLIQSRLDTVGHEEKGWVAPSILDRLARMCSHEGRRVMAIVNPTSPSALVRPGNRGSPNRFAGRMKAEPSIERMWLRLIDAVRTPPPDRSLPVHALTETSIGGSSTRACQRFSGLSGPAPKPSSEIENPATRTLS